ncbi:MAG: ankyrin repeat domain-containing protein [Candidatus Moranbacteria bacterium]|jgi:ankyrin repeat protein|nr:ankyrin repeat domain-containing protein [Candidatus Moranbacteria bacterium]
MSPIFIAIKKGKIENVKALIKNGADVNFKSKSKMNPLYYAKKRIKLK